MRNAHQLDLESTGVLLLAKNKTVFVALANLFGSEKPLRTYVALVQGSPRLDRFEISARLAPHPTLADAIRVDNQRGKRATTQFEVSEKYTSHALLNCHAATDRPHQVRAHLSHAGLPIVGDALYGGGPLLLSRLKPGYRLKEGHTELPLISNPALHAESLNLVHPVTCAPLGIHAPWPKTITVAVKYLRRYAVANS